MVILIVILIVMPRLAITGMLTLCRAFSLCLSLSLSQISVLFVLFVLLVLLIFQVTSPLHHPAGFGAKDTADCPVAGANSSGNGNGSSISSSGSGQVGGREGCVDGWLVPWLGAW